MLPAFANLDEEAEEIERATYDRLSQMVDSGEEDPASLHEQARDEGINHYATMQAAVTGIVNLFTAGLYHLFEQQMGLFFRRGLFFPGQATEYKSVDDAKRRLAERTVKIEALPAYSEVYELRLLANCIKHGDGWSCDALKAQRPILPAYPVRHPGSQSVRTWSGNSTSGRTGPLCHP